MELNEEDLMIPSPWLDEPDNEHQVEIESTIEIKDILPLLPLVPVKRLKNFVKKIKEKNERAKV